MGESTKIVSRPMGFQASRLRVGLRVMGLDLRQLIGAIGCEGPLGQGTLVFGRRLSCR